MKEHAEVYKSGSTDFFKSLGLSDSAMAFIKSTIDGKMRGDRHKEDHTELDAKELICSMPEIFADRLKSVVANILL